MKISHVALMLLAGCSGICCFAQDADFGNVTKEELLDQTYPADPAASAVVLYRDISVKFEYRQSDGFHVVTHVHERIKIYNKEGFLYATVFENLYKSQSENESLTNLRGFTYNLEGDQIVKSKVKGSDSFTKSLNKYYDQVAFTMPNVREGSVIEYQYRLDSPFAYSIDEIKLQYDIPIKQQEVSVAVPEYYYFKPVIKGYLPVNPTFSNTTGKIVWVGNTGTNQGFVNNSNYTQRTKDYRVSTTRFSMKDVPALIEEPYVNDMDNYRAAINYELQYVQFPQSSRKDYTGSWESVVKTINASDHFGRQLSASRAFREQLKSLLEGVDDDARKMAVIFRHVQQHMNWNGYLGYNTDKGVKDAYKDQTGNIADINLMLIGLLREAGFNSRPVLISTRDNGIPLFPTLEGFNYVIAAVSLNGEEYFLDASNKYASPNIIPTRALNWHGTLIRDDGSIVRTPVLPASPSREIHMMNIDINTDGTIDGKVRKTYTDYKAFDFRNDKNSLGEDDYLEGLENENEGMAITNYSIDHKEDPGKAIVENFEFRMEGQVQSAPDRILFTPLLHQAISSNPFRLESREYPIDFTYPWQLKHLFTIRLPEGYRVSHLPEGIHLVLADNLGSFSYQLKDLGNGNLQLLSDLSINQAVVPATYYPMLKEFYKSIIEKETEKVVLSKITSDEHTERAAGGR